MMGWALAGAGGEGGVFAGEECSVVEFHEGWVDVTGYAVGAYDGVEEFCGGLGLES